MDAFTFAVSQSAYMADIQRWLIIRRQVITVSCIPFIGKNGHFSPFYCHFSGLRESHIFQARATLLDFIYISGLQWISGWKQKATNHTNCDRGVSRFGTPCDNWQRIFKTKTNIFHTISNIKLTFYDISVIIVCIIYKKVLNLPQLLLSDKTIHVFYDKRN